MDGNDAGPSRREATTRSRPSSRASLQDGEPFDGEKALANIRKRRAGEPTSNPQARIYRKARMRTRNWSELRQRNDPDAVVPAPAAAIPATVQEEPESPPVMDVDSDVAQEPEAVVTQQQPAATNSGLTPTHLPRDHLLLLVPATPEIAQAPS